MSKALEQALEALQDEYAAACAERDAVNATNAPIEEELTKVCAEMEALRPRMNELSEQIDKNRGADWLERKRNIGRLANSIMDIKRQLGLAK